MGNLSNQQHIEHLERKMGKVAQLFNARTEIAWLEDKMTLNQAVLETKYGKLEKSMALMLESQAKIQEGLNQLLMRNATPQNSHYPNASQNMTRNSPRSTSLTINPLPIPSPVIVQHQHSSPIPTPYLNPPLIPTTGNNNQQLQIHYPQKSSSPSPKKTVTPFTNHPSTPIPNLNQKDPKNQNHIFLTPLNHISITQRKWRRKRRRWKIRKKIRKKERRLTRLAAARVAVSGRFGGYIVDGKRRARSFCGQSKGVLIGGGGDIRLKTVMDLKLLGFLGLVREEKKRRKGKNEGGSCGWSEEETAGKFWSTTGGEEGQSMMFGYGCGNPSSNLGFRKRVQALIERGVLLFNFDDVIDDTSTYETSRPSMNLWGHDALVDFILRVAQTNLSPLPCANLRIFSPLQILFTPILNFDPFIFQVHTPIFVTRCPTEFSFNIPNSATCGKFFLNRLSFPC
ncbi:unnamed protein product [Amaranthus hypochondriacus]